MAATSAAARAVAEKQAQETMALQNTIKRDRLIEIEKKMQAKWANDKIFEANAPASEDASLVNLSEAEMRAKYPKWFGTSPYAYMNGSLHLGHAFTISKIEFAAGVERMMGKRVLVPIGFHCTGMPIKAASDKLIREMERFGKDFEDYNEEEATSNSIPVGPPPASTSDATAPSTSATTSNVDKAKKGKLNAKSTGLTYQFQIMESIGVPRSEIKKFADPLYWLKYFPPIAQQDLKAFGAKVDWRRSFLTTDANPYYDAFVRWQVNKLHKLGYIKFGERYTIYSPKDGQPCMDHDRSSGEGVGPQEYTGIKMEVLEWSEQANAEIGQAIGGKQVFLVAATLRPETMYGQTNCFVGNTINYGLYLAKGENQVYLCTERSARNMAYQGLLRNRDQVEKIAELKGKAIVGARIRAPNSLAPNSEVYVLPMEGVLATKGTGVVTSVPSDSPDDYATLVDLRKKAEYYGIDPKWAAIDPIPVLKTPTYGDLTAPALCKQFKINSQKDTKQLAEAKEIAYKEGFYGGVMVAGDFKGQKVEEVKNKVRDQMIQAGNAFIYSEPEGAVMSRSADECVVALCDQWYMAYGEEVWKKQARKLLANMKITSQETRNAFEGTLNWMHEWACARSYGLGTKLPWDPQFLVESLSDSTIYMSYYTIAHLLHADIEGKTPGSLGIKPEQMTDEVWDHILSDGAFPESSPISQDQSESLLKEFKYWYPMDLRSSGKDLINNHLTMCIYVHAALFPEAQWPQGMRANGHLLLNGKKMAKSTGNSLTLADSVRKFGADASRVALADAGDGMEDANFEEYTANASILRLYTLIDWSEEQIRNQSSLRTGDYNAYDTIFENEIKLCIEKSTDLYANAMYKDALKYALYELLNARDWYRDATKSLSNSSIPEPSLHRDLVLYFIRIQALLLNPVAPHTAEHLYCEVLGEKESVQNARFPQVDKPTDHAIINAVAYIRTTVKEIRDAELALIKKKAKKGKGADLGSYDPSQPKVLDLYVAKDYPEWQQKCVGIIKEAYNSETKTIVRSQLKQLVEKAGLVKDKKVMPFCVNFQNNIDTLGEENAFNRGLGFDEESTLRKMSPYIQRQLGLKELRIAVAEQSTGSEHDSKVVATAEPGKPTFAFTNPS